ncbi:hypothetical protein EVAR_75137_1 [Eumeta japonica]|uniref:Uncharacterized protein n=1 Tax=Eumeta variegata TaxID=151549 RepID=A0A4C1U1A6_EUMVA|nr:hypothetical protein EVAR_75137_1 [Eumeta japonica]
MGVLGPDPPAPGEQGNLGPRCRLSRRCLINRLLFVGRTIYDAGRPNSRSSTDRYANTQWDAQLCLRGMSSSKSFNIEVCYRPSKRDTEDRVRIMEGGRATPGIGEEHLQGRWSQVRPGLPFPEGERPAPGSLQITSLTPLVVECGGGAADSISRAGRVAGGDLHKSE